MSRDTLQLPPGWQTDEPGQSMFVVDLYQVGAEHMQHIQQCFQDHGLTIESQCRASQPDRIELQFIATTVAAWDLFQALLLLAPAYQFDVCVAPLAMQPVRLLICDMDSTMVASETLDELAALAGVGERVSDITTRAMRGEIDFTHALQERVALLQGTDTSLLMQVASDTLINKGAGQLLDVARHNGIRTVLVSGGFDTIVADVAEKLGFDHYICNRLQTAAGKITGTVDPPVVDANTKLQTLLQECDGLRIEPQQACCIGDGANDLPMLIRAGIGVSYRGKPLLRRTIAYQLNYTDLTAVIPLLGLRSAA